MDVQTLWLLALSISTPIAGVIGFAIQLRQVRKSKLENEKLLLEIAALKLNQTKVDRRIVQVTTEEVLRYGRDDIALSRGNGPNPGPESDLPARASFAGHAMGVLLALLFIAFVGYALYDIYRLVRWAANAL